MIAERLDILTAFDEGYKVALMADGVADLTKPDGSTYGVDLNVPDRGSCTCPDFQHRGGSYQSACKHMWWVSQLTPCSYCQSVMVLDPVSEIFECCNEDCGHAKSLGLVKAQRAERRTRQAQRVA